MTVYVFRDVCSKPIAPEDVVEELMCCLATVLGFIWVYGDLYEVLVFCYAKYFKLWNI